jgi:DDE superfamily endonuclease
VQYPDAERIILVLNELNTHSPASFYAAFPPAEAIRLADRLEIHHTPKHGSWLNVAETELAVLERQCLRQRFDGRTALAAAAPAWAARRNISTTAVNWRFNSADARTKLKRLYPVLQP